MSRRQQRIAWSFAPAIDESGPREAGFAQAGFTLVRSAGVLLVVAPLLISACGSSATADSAEPSAATATVIESELPDAAADITDAPEAIRIPVSLYVLTDADDPSSVLSSRRTTDEVQAIAAEVQAIWQPAGVVFDPIHVEEVAVPAEVLEAVARSGDTSPFFDHVGRTFDVPAPGVINGFYVAGAAGVNGFTPAGSTVFFVVDEPSVHDERVSSHEIGHILGLRHATDDAGRLMFSGTNGTSLTAQEIEVVRYGAEGLVGGTR